MKCPDGDRREVTKDLSILAVGMYRRAAVAEDFEAVSGHGLMSTFDPGNLSPAMATLFDHWSERREALGRLPGRRDIDLDRIRQIIPSLWLLGVERDPLRFRLRLIGEAIRAANHDEIRPGAYVDEITTEFGDRTFLDRLIWMVETRRPDHYLGPPTASHLPELSKIERLSVPLADDGVTVDRILSCTFSIWRTGLPPRPTFGR